MTINDAGPYVKGEIITATVCRNCKRVFLGASTPFCFGCGSEELIKVCEDEISEAIIADYDRRAQ